LVKLTKTYFMVMVSDMDRAREFYRGVFALEEAFASPEWTELRFGDATIALHGGPAGEDRPTGLGFEVDDVDAACRAIEAHGGRLAKPPEDRPGEGIKLADAVDPEGNHFSVGEPTGGWG
jgi:predicted enzyme related to lactoylglutathione lyase